MVVFGNKHAFWGALVLALIIFWTGILLGVMFENSRADRLNSVYFNSETEIFDLNLQQSLLSSQKLDCSFAMEQKIAFADRIYQEARQLEKYDSSNKITDNLLQLHERYDLLRTMLWNSFIQDNNCSMNSNVVVYLYQYNQPSIEINAKQATLSKVLIELKERHGDDLVLIPIAGDTGVASLEILKKEFGINELPTIIVNNNYKTSDLITADELENHLYKK